jgi:hypothetical protein
MSYDPDAPRRAAIMDKEYADRLFDARPHPKTHAIIACMLGREANTPQKFVGRAIITSDGFCQCNFVDGAGTEHHQAFVGSWDEIEENVQLVAEDLSIPEEQTAALLKDWIGIDYQSRSTRMRRALTD